MFKLGVDEFNFSNCYLRLMSLLQELPTLEGILMCSLFMLPKETGRRLQIYEEFFRHGASLHFIMENAVVRVREDIDFVEELFQLSETLKTCPEAISADFLAPLGGADFFSCEPEQSVSVMRS